MFYGKIKSVNKIKIIREGFSLQSQKTFQVVKLIKYGNTNARVQLDDGRRVKTPLQLGVVGAVFLEDDIISVVVQGKIDWYHRTLRKEKRMPKVLERVRSEPVSVRDKNRQAKADRDIVKACILKYIQSLPRNSMVTEELEDLTSSIYMHLYQRGFFDGYDSTKSNYTTWCFKAVRNYMITMWRSRDRDFNVSMLRLEMVLDGDGAPCTLRDLTPDRSFMLQEEAVMAEAVSDRFKIIASSMDEAALYEDGLPTHIDIFEAIRDNMFDELMEKHVGKYRKKQFMEKVAVYRQCCQKVYTDEFELS